MRNRKKLPIGIDSFEKIIRHNFYYVDKTEMITELLHNWGEVNLFTRPRRFGKSLNMNMLQSFLEIGCDKSLRPSLNLMVGANTPPELLILLSMTCDGLVRTWPI